MKRLILYCFLAVYSLSVPASLQKGWSGWLQNYETALKQAKKQNRPILIYFDALWCSWCQQYKTGVLDKPAVKSVLSKSWIPLVLDYDAHPDLFHRYGGVGLPYTVLLSAQGRVINRFSGILAEKDFLQTLTEAVGSQAMPDADRVVLSEAVILESLNSEGFDAFQNAFLEHIDTLYSPDLSTLAGHYETGATLKRPSPRTWLYLMQRGLWPQRSSKAMRIESSRLLDEIDGGFFNFFDSHRLNEAYLESSKLLEVNAWMLAWYASAAGKDRVASIAARSGWTFLQNVLWDKQLGGFWQAQVANNAYYEAPLLLRAKLLPPPVDRLKRADTNAQAAIALHQAGLALSNKDMQATARRNLRYILEHMVKHGHLYHVYQPSGLSVPALPQDLFWVLLAVKEMPGMENHAGVKTVLKQAQQWLDAQRLAKTNETLQVGLAGLIAQTVCKSVYTPRFPLQSCEWALKQLRIDAESAPDSLIPGLLALENYVNR